MSVVAPARTRKLPPVDHCASLISGLTSRSPADAVHDATQTLPEVQVASLPVVHDSGAPEPRIAIRLPKPVS